MLLPQQVCPDANSPCQPIGADAPIRIPNGFAVTYHHLLPGNNEDVYLLGFNEAGQVLFNKKVNTTTNSWTKSRIAALGNRVGVLFARDVAAANEDIHFRVLDTMSTFASTEEILTTVGGGRGFKIAVLSDQFVIGVNDLNVGLRGVLKFRDPDGAPLGVDVPCESPLVTEIIGLATADSNIGMLYTTVATKGIIRLRVLNSQHQVIHYSPDIVEPAAEGDLEFTGHEFLGMWRSELRRTTSIPMGTLPLRWRDTFEAVVLDGLIPMM